MPPMIRSSLVLMAVSALTGCVNLAERCGDATPSGACLSVVSVTPTTNGELTANVDVVQGKCGKASVPEDQTDEPFRDHDVAFTLRNEGPISVRDPASYGPAVVVEGFEVTFTLNSICDGCPLLDPLRGLGPTVTVLGGQEVKITLPLMPIRTKDEFLAKQGNANQFPSYSASYELRARDPEGELTIEGATTFSVGNFDYCEN